MSQVTILELQLQLFQEIFEKIDSYKKGSVFLRDVVEILGYITSEPPVQKVRQEVY